MKTVAFITLGCKVNQYETNAMTQKFIEEGYKIVEQHEKADIYVVNTCTVTNMSDRKSRQMLRRVKDANPKAIVVACGCYAQVAEKNIEKIEEVDIIVGNNEKSEIVEKVENFIKTNKKEIEIGNVMQQKEFINFGDITYSEKTRATIKIQDGCDRFCTYCIIPYARGRVRSRKPENVLSEVEKIARQGIKEIVITGIHIASYGKDFKKEYGLIDLLEELNNVEGIERIRLGSIEPLLITEKFMERLIKLEKVCHHFHLSLQSGCDETLKRMNRRYTTKQFSKIVALLRKYYKDVILTTDIIVGFPGETEEEFEETYKFLKHINFYKMHIFKYSPRKGTKAEAMSGQVDGNKKENRSQRLIELSNKNEKRYNQSYVGKEVQILWEEEKNKIHKGHTKNYILAYLKENEDSKNKEAKKEDENNKNKDLKKEDENSKKLENQITSAKCIEAKDDHIVVEL